MCRMCAVLSLSGSFLKVTEWIHVTMGIRVTVCVFYRLIHPQQRFQYRLQKNNGVQRESHGCSSSGASCLGKIKHLDFSHIPLRAASRPAVAHYDTQHFDDLPFKGPRRC